MLMKAVLDGQAKDGDLDLSLDLFDRIEGTTICALAEAFCWPLRSFVKKFRGEFESYVRERAAV